jgi:hypothetical protein
MIKQPRTSYTVLVKSREMAGVGPKHMVAGGREGVKTTEDKIHWPRRLPFFFSVTHLDPTIIYKMISTIIQ